MNAPVRNLPAPAALQPTRTEVFVGEVLPPDRLGALSRSLPAHIKPERFERNLLTAVTQHPKLLGCKPADVFNEVAKAAALGLLLDPQLGEAYLITSWSKDGDVPQLRLGYRGLIKLARQSGQVANVYAHEVCERDEFHTRLGTDKSLEHTPDYRNGRGATQAYYAVVEFKDGGKDFDVMSIPEIHVIRDRSDGWKAFKAGRIKSTPWGTDEGEMAKKTVLRRLLKRIPQSPEMADALRLEDEDYTGFKEVTPAVGRAGGHLRLTGGFTPRTDSAAVSGDTAGGLAGGDEPTESGATVQAPDQPLELISDLSDAGAARILAWVEIYRRAIADAADAAALKALRKAAFDGGQLRAVHDGTDLSAQDLDRELKAREQAIAATSTSDADFDDFPGDQK